MGRSSGIPGFGTGCRPPWRGINPQWRPGGEPLPATHLSVIYKFFKVTNRTAEAVELGCKH